jgi:hypothetical protein
MEENIINLRFDKIVTNLTGNKLGRSVYKKQIESQLEYNKKNVIVFPEQIEDVGISFFQGLCHALLEKFGRKEINTQIEIRAQHKDIIEKFKKTIDL